MTEEGVPGLNNNEGLEGLDSVGPRSNDFVRLVSSRDAGYTNYSPYQPSLVSSGRWIEAEGETVR